MNIKTRMPRIEAFLFFVFLASPLLYIPGYLELSIKLRFLVLLSLSLAVLATVPLRQKLAKNYRHLPKALRIFVVVTTSMMALSVLRQSDYLTVAIGNPPEFLGLLAWLSFIVLALTWMDDVDRLLLGKTSLGIGIAAMVASLYFGLFYIGLGLRLPGILLQATSMGMYASMFCLISFYGLARATRRNDSIVATLGVIGSVTVLLLSQSRIGYLTLIIVLAAYAALTVRKRFQVAVLAVSIVVLVGLVPRLFPSYFERFGSASIDRGVSYRLDLYRTTLPDVLRHNSIIGNGPSSLPTAINNQNTVPEPIKRSLQTGELFASTHDLYFDVAYFFGGLAALALLGASGYALFVGWRIRDLQIDTLRLIFITLIINACFNVPSLTLTSLYFVVLFGLLATTHKPKRSNDSRKI